jgi:hypothetical protein
METQGQLQLQPPVLSSWSPVSDSRHAAIRPGSAGAMLEGSFKSLSRAP